jgi:peptidyl-prolyl cis-trans isomerase C
MGFQVNNWMKAGLITVLLGSMTGQTAAAEISDGVDALSVEAVRADLLGVPAGVRAQMTAAQLNLYVTNLLLDRRLERAAIQTGLEASPEVKARLERARREILSRSLVEGEMARVEAKLPDLKALARERYQANPGAYMAPEAVRVSHILFAVNEEDPAKRDAVAKERAREVLNRLRAGADFKKLAEEYSDDAGSKRNGGEIPGWAEKGKFVPPFETAAFAMKPDEISDLVRSRFGYHIIRLDEKRAASQLPFEAVAARIENEVRRDVLAERREEVLRPYRGRKPVALDEATLKALRNP